MANNNKEELQKALQYLNSLEKSVKDLYEKNKTSFSRTKKLRKEFDDFKLIIESTRQRLQNPTLSIAMVGTTSAGKSTIVNAFNARRVAPMEAQEMSAGILKLTHSQHTQMNVEATTGAKWPVGQYSCKSDAEIYEEVGKIYDKYRRHINSAEPPIINVTGPILWQSNRSILDIPDELSVEFYDLPGLRTLDDNKNMAVIQSTLQKSFCIIPINYDDVDERRIERLVQEVSDIVKSRGGKTDFLLFVLNKVDHANADDRKIADRIKTLQNAIATKLKTVAPQDIIILPFVGILLYSIQVALKRDERKNIVGVDYEKLRNLFDDCSNVFSKGRDSFSDDEEELYLRIDSACRRKKEISIEDLSAFEKICYRLSQADEINEEIKKRIAESFREVIILPILSELTNHFDKLMEELDYYVSVRKKTSRLDLISEEIKVMRMNFFLLGSSDDELYNDLIGFVDAVSLDLQNLNVPDNDTIRKRRLMTKVSELKQEIEKRSLGYIDAQIEEITTSANNMANGLKMIKAADKAVSFLRENKGERTISIFENVSKIPEEIRSRLNIDVLFPFKNHIGEKKSKAVFIEDMCKIISNKLAKDMASMYDNIFSLFYTIFSDEGFSKNGKYYKKTTEVELPDTKRIQIRETYDWTDIRMRDILSKRTNYCFQLESDGFKMILMHYLQNELSTILGKLTEEIAVEDSNLDKMIDTALAVKPISIVLPKDLFEFARPQSFDKETSGTRSVLVGTKHHSCKADEKVYMDEKYSTYTYEYESEIGLHERWNDGIQKSMSDFWDIITSWIIKCINQYMTNVKLASEEVREMAMSIIEEKHKSDAEALRINELSNESLVNQINTIKLLNSKYYK